VFSTLFQWLKVSGKLQCFAVTGKCLAWGVALVNRQSEVFSFFFGTVFLNSGFFRPINRGKNPIKNRFKNIRIAIDGNSDFCHVATIPGFSGKHDTGIDRDAILNSGLIQFH
jgi:hypothetical protein